jgi:hypothetical protein
VGHVIAECQPPVCLGGSSSASMSVSVFVSVSCLGVFLVLTSSVVCVYVFEQVAAMKMPCRSAS